MKRLLVIGGTGFIGYHIIKEAKKKKNGKLRVFL